VLVVDPDPAARRALVLALERAGRPAVGAGSAREARAADRPPALAVLEIVLPDGDGLGLLDELRARWPGLAAVVVTRYPEPRSIVEAMRRGALDYLSKPVDVELLLPFCRALPAAGASPADAPVALAGDSPAMARLRDEVARLARGRLASVLIAGPDGAGKSWCARALHAAGARAGRPLLPYACRGAHAPGPALLGPAGPGTGGLLDAAAGGTLVLDDVDRLEPEVAAALLGRLEAEEGRTLVAGLTVRPEADGPLLRWLGRVRLHLPPLAERPEDVLPLARAILGARPDGRPPLTPGAEARLAGRAWPGHAAELAALLERARALAGEAPVGAEHLDAALAGTALPPWAPGGAVRPLREVTQAYIGHALAQARGNRSRAARMLGVSRETLRVRLGRRDWRHADHPR
jgi:DNA-binding NtrC family response regulator